MKETTLKSIINAIGAAAAEVTEKTIETNKRYNIKKRKEELEKEFSNRFGGIPTGYKELDSINESSTGKLVIAKKDNEIVEGVMCNEKIYTIDDHVITNWDEIKKEIYFGSIKNCWLVWWKNNREDPEWSDPLDEQ